MAALYLVALATVIGRCLQCWGHVNPVWRGCDQVIAEELAARLTHVI